ncbi:muscleblind-like protein 3 isoform X5 [Scaptodrosophila lebanonensis]|uniref:Muscleblind-like protein 3 isoform X5 n=1 Tax=Drosophila lebanonensis TaxID=7225 RepID=A0A6J2UIH4_DROLE|nr:muscleblind-like protein 3 isoform X5 [Scaptodrosophila lebanonensis]
MASVVNMNSLLNGKDSRWLQLEVCREFQRNKCSRQDTECKFAHPPANVEVQNGKVTACYDSIKGRCNRDKPPCKYFHPPQHLKDQLLINGRNHLALKNALMQQMGITPGQPVISGQVPAVATNPYLTGIPASTYSPYYAPGHLVPALLGPDPTAVASQLGPVVPQAVQVAQQKIPRSDRLEQFSGMVPFKRPAAEKSGIPVYQPGATTYQQLMQPYVPVSYDKVEVIDQRVAVCRDHANSQCRRKQCKYYHIPIVLPPANIMAAMITNPNEQQTAAAANATAIVAPTTAAAAATGGYNSNLIIIEPHHQQQHHQQQQQQQFSYHTNNNNYYHINNNNSNIGNANKPAAHTSNIYQQQQQQQQHPHMPPMAATYHSASPYSPSSASSSSSCSIATSPTLSSATTLSTTSTATMPTPQQQYATAPAAFLKAAPTPLAMGPGNATTYYDAAPTLVLSSDYNSNCIPILAATQAQAQFISLSAPQQHLLKYTPAQQHQQHAYIGHQPQMQQQHHHHHYQAPVGTVVATTVAAMPATTLTVTPATGGSPSNCI